MADTKPHFEDTAPDIKSYLWSLKHAAEVDHERAARAIELAQEDLYEARREFEQLPSDDQIAELTDAELAALCETHGVFVPDRLLIPEEEAVAA